MRFGVWVFLTVINLAHVSGQAFQLLGDAMQVKSTFPHYPNNFDLGVCPILKALSIPGSNSKRAIKMPAKMCVCGQLLLGEQLVSGL